MLLSTCVPCREAASGLASAGIPLQTHRPQPCTLGQRSQLQTRHPSCLLQVFLQSPAGSAAASLLLSLTLNVTVGPPDLTQTLVGSDPWHALAAPAVCSLMRHRSQWHEGCPGWPA